MVKSRSAVVQPTIPLRQSPRKRKRDDGGPHEIVPPAAIVPAAARDTPKKKRDTATVGPTNSIALPQKGKSVKTEVVPTTGSIQSAELPRIKQIPKAESNVPTIIENEQHDQVTQVQPEPEINSVPKVVKKRKTKEEKEAEAMPLAARTLGHKMYVGAHVSMAKGVENAVTNAIHIGGNAFALFLKSQRKWENPPLKDENRDAFRQACTEHKFDAMSHVVPHGSYLVNLATPDKDKTKQAYDAFVDDLHRCEALGIKLYNFHPGTTNQEPLDEAIERIANNLNRALAETKTVIPLLENMAGRGNVIGSRFSDLRDIIAGIKPEYKDRIGICIDTCHAFAAGYDLRSPETFQKTLQELDEIVGLKYLKAMHLNDSKAPFQSHRDLHQNIGVGFLGLRAFHNIMNEPRLQGIPLVLETPCDRPDPADPKGKKTIDDKNMWAREIKLLESLTGMDPDGSEFKALEKELSDRGHAERLKMAASVAATEEKKRKKLEKGQKNISDIFGSKKIKKGQDEDMSDESDLGGS